MFTIKKIIRYLAAFCTFFVFLPSFLVSCSGQKVEVSAVTAVTGVKMYGETVVDPHPVVLLCIFIPIAIIVITYTAKFIDKDKAKFIAAITAVDVVLWAIFKSVAKSIADENLCSFETTAWYWINLLFLLSIITLSILVFIGKYKMDYDLSNKISTEDTKKVINQISDKVTEVSGKVSDIAKVTINDITKVAKNENVIGYCSVCGMPLTYDLKFCTKCGEPLPDFMLEKAEARKKEIEKEIEEKNKKTEAIKQKPEIEDEEEVAEAEIKKLQETSNKENIIGYCINCGSPLMHGTKFCINCGEPIYEPIVEKPETNIKEVEQEAKEQIVITELTEQKLETEEKVENEVIHNKKLCKKCGAEIDDDSVFCNFCGEKIEQ